MILALRITNRNVRGYIQLPNPLHLPAARAVAAEWQKNLGPTWTVALLDDAGGTILTGDSNHAR